MTEDGLRSVYYLQIFTPNHCLSTAVSKGGVRVRSDSTKAISAVCLRPVALRYGSSTSGSSTPIAIILIKS